MWVLHYREFISVTHSTTHADRAWQKSESYPHDFACRICRDRLGGTKIRGTPCTCTVCKLAQHARDLATLLPLWHFKGIPRLSCLDLLFAMQLCPLSVMCYTSPCCPFRVLTSYDVRHNCAEANPFIDVCDALAPMGLDWKWHLVGEYYNWDTPTTFVENSLSTTATTTTTTTTTISLYTWTSYSELSQNEMEFTNKIGCLCDQKAMGKATLLCSYVSHIGISNCYIAIFTHRIGWFIDIHVGLHTPLSLSLSLGAQ